MRIPGIDIVHKLKYFDFTGPYVKLGEPSSVIGQPEFENCEDALLSYFRSMFYAKRMNAHNMLIATCTATDSIVAKEVLLPLIGQIRQYEMLLQSGGI